MTAKRGATARAIENVVQAEFDNQIDNLDQIIKEFRDLVSSQQPDAKDTPETYAHVRVDRFSTIQILLESLSAFGKRHQEFFMRGLDGKAAILFESSPEYPREAVLRLIQNQIDNDTDVIIKAYAQRMEGSPIAVHHEALQHADKLAYRMLLPALSKTAAKANSGLITPCTVLTYFCKAPKIRIVPYAPVALIGIPYPTSDALRSAYLSIPHEIGHYIYRHGPLLANGSGFDSHFKKLMVNKPLWLRNWMEEIFADVYSVLAAGPAVALSSQYMAKSNPLSSFTGDNGEHPSPALRPFLYTLALKGIDDVNQPDVEKLEDLWEKYLRQERDLGDKSLLSLRDDYGNSLTLTVSEARKQVGEVVKAVVASLSNQELLNTWQETRALWGGSFKRDLADDPQLNSTLTAIDFAAIKDAPDLQPDADNDKRYRVEKCHPIPASDWLTIGETSLWYEQLRNLMAKDATPSTRMPSEAWVAMLLADGWAEGPGGSTPSIK